MWMKERWSIRLVPEPSGAVTTAALLFHLEELPPFQRAVAVLSGGNTAPELLAEVLTETHSARIPGIRKPG